MPATLRGWPGRRWVAAGLLLPILVLAFAASAGASSRSTPWNWAATVVAAVLAALLLASYLPLPGRRRLELGCSQCAVIAALAVPLALMARASAPDGAAMAAIAVLLLMGGLRQRLLDAGSCRGPNQA